MFYSPSRPAEQDMLSISQINNLLRAPTKDDNEQSYDCQAFSAFNVSPKAVKPFSIFGDAHIELRRDVNFDQSSIEMAPYKQQTLLITSTKERAAPRRFDLESSPVRQFELRQDSDLRSNVSGYKAFAQKRIGKLNMEHVHTTEPSCQSPTSNLNDCKLESNSEKYLKAPTKANIMGLKTCPSPDQDDVTWRAAEFSLEDKQIPANSFQSPRITSLAKMGCPGNNSVYHDSTDFTEKHKCF